MPDRERLSKIALDWERDRSFERDNEFLDQEDLPKKEPEPIMKHFGEDWKDRRDRRALLSAPRSNPKSRSRRVRMLKKPYGDTSHHQDPVPHELPHSPASTADSYVTAPTDFDPDARAFSPDEQRLHHNRELPSPAFLSGHPVTSNPMSWTASTHDPRLGRFDMACWHQHPRFKKLSRPPPVSPFQVIMSELFRSQAAKDMSMMADMAREQAEYWWSFVPRH